MIPEASYCIQDSKGNTCNLNSLGSSGTGMIFSGSCNTGDEDLDIIATYISNGSGLALTAFGVTVPNFTNSLKWGQTGMWIDTKNNGGTVQMGFCSQ